jgi:hypothetical protein
MHFLSMRPTFDTVVPCTKEELIREVSQQLESHEWNWESHDFGGYIELHVPQKQVRYWSPHLSISLEESDGATAIHGRFAPRQNVWTLVWVSYLAFAFAGLYAILYTVSAWHAGIETFVWLFAPLSVLGVICLYAVSYLGQSWSRDQMDSLKTQWNELLRRAIHSSGAADNG